MWTKEHYGELLETGGGKERMTAHWNEVGWPAGYEDAESQQALVKELHLRKTAIFNEMITKGEIPIRKGVLNLIDEALADGVPVGVCSTASAPPPRHRREYKEPDAGKPPSGSSNRRASDAAPRADRGTASPTSLAALSLAE